MRPIWYSNNAPTVATRGPSTPALPGNGRTGRVAAKLNGGNEADILFR